MEDNQLQDSLFAKIMPVLDEYMKCKLKLQQLRQSSEQFPGIEQEIKYDIKYHAKIIEQMIMQDAENQ